VKEVHFHRGRHSLGKISPGSVNGIWVTRRMSTSGHENGKQSTRLTEARFRFQLAR
jgi:hypothetical protein